MNARKPLALGLSAVFHLSLLSAFLLFGQFDRKPAPGPDRVIDIVDIKELLPRQSAVPAAPEKPEAVPLRAAQPISLPPQFSAASPPPQGESTESGLTDEAPVDGPGGGMALPSGSPPPVTPDAEPVYVQQFQITDVPVLPAKEIRSRIVYPPLAAKQGIEATVYLELFIDQSGLIKKATVLKDPGHGFAEAALSALPGVKCSPAKIDGQSVAVRFRYPLRFQLK
jgi:TonB family protein